MNTARKKLLPQAEVVCGIFLITVNVCERFSFCVLNRW